MVTRRLSYFRLELNVYTAKSDSICILLLQTVSVYCYIRQYLYTATSDSICQSELYCKLHLTHFHYPYQLQLIQK
jgi:hypothetical protein